MVTTIVAKAGDVIIRQIHGAGFELVDALTRTPIARFANEQAVLAVAGTHRGAVWHESVADPGELKLLLKGLSDT
jgi:hypothetical protein